jgi:hypothetical protein
MMETQDTVIRELHGILKAALLGGTEILYRRVIKLINLDEVYIKEQ